MMMGALEKRRTSKPVGYSLGIAAGFTSLIAHAGGPTASICLIPQALARGIFVGTSLVFFTAPNLIKLVPYTAAGLLRVGNIPTILLLPLWAVWACTWACT